MLPPIQSVSNMRVQYNLPQRQNQEGQPRSGQDQQQGNRNPQTAVAVSSGAANRINLLSLAGEDGMASDLNRFAQAIAKALDMPPMRGESAAMHALRLAEAVLALNAGPRMALERQLGTLLQGLPLQLVALALKHPGGAEAARIAAFLELSRQKADAVTDAVVASYAQNEGSDEDDFAYPLPVRTSGPEIELKGVTLPLSLEAQLAQAAHFAALRAGIALPYVHYAIEDQPPETEDEAPGHHAFSGEESAEGDPQEDEAGDGEGLAAAADDSFAEEGDGETLALPAPTETGAEADDIAYSYYRRLSEDL